MDLVLDGSTLIQLAFGLLILWVVFILTPREQRLKLSEPPLVPYEYPIIGHTIDYFKDNVNFIKKCHEEYGEIFSLYVFGRIITVVDNKLSPEVFKSFKDFSFSGAQMELFPLDHFLRRPRVFLRNMTETVQKTFPGDLKLFMERIQRELPKAVDDIIGDGKVLQPPIKSFKVIIAKLVATCVVEDLTDDKELVIALAHATDDFTPYLSIPPILSFIHPTLHKYLIVGLFRMNNPFKARRDLIKQKITQIIDKRLHEMKNQGDDYITPVDVLQNYIGVFHDDYDAITDIIICTTFAAINSTATFLTHSLQEFANYPQFREELLKEQEELSKDDDENILNKIAKMEKLDSLLKETLRVNADNIGLPHKVLASHFTFSNGYQVPKDRFVYIYMHEIHSNEKAYGSDPSEFNALRHLKNPASHVERSFLTFGLGKHACPGRNFAISGIKHILHYLLLRYNVKNVGNEIVRSKLIGPFRLPDDTGMIFEKKIK